MTEQEQADAVGAWLGARFGNAIDAIVDREIKRPPVIIDPSAAYGMDDFGRVYAVGQPAVTTTTVPRTTTTSGTMMVGIAVILLVLLAKD